MQYLKRIKILQIIKILFIILIVYLIYYSFGFYIVKTNNMIPSFKPGTLIIYYKLDKDYNNKDVVVTKTGLYRIIGVSKDTIDIQNNTVLINSIKEEDSLLYTYADILKYPYTVKDNEYFVLNDYRTNTNDSRHFGSINKSEILGKVITSIQIRGF